MKTPIFSARLSLFLLTRRRRQGFSMLEVLVALFAAFFFLMGTMNAMVIAAVMQVKAERQAQALYWIQQDLEAVRAEASQLTSSTACTGTFNANTSYGALLLSRIGTMTSPVTLTNSSISTTVSSVTKTVTINGSNVTYQGKRQTQVAYVNPSVPSSAFTANSTKKIVSQEYRLIRIVEGYDNSPQILTISYVVGLPDDAQNTLNPVNQTYPKLSNANSSIVATLYTEILPNAAVSC